MPIDNRDLTAGTTLTVTYKGKQHRCEVVQTGEGRKFKLEDGRVFNSPSSAGKAVTGRVSCDGWKFWSVAGKEGLRGPATRPIGKPTRSKRLRLIKKLPNQKGVEEGQTRWFCSACQKGFNMPTGQEPAACPEGHPWQTEDEFETAS